MSVFAICVYVCARACLCVCTWLIVGFVCERGYLCVCLCAYVSMCVVCFCVGRHGCIQRKNLSCCAAASHTQLNSVTYQVKLQYFCSMHALCCKQTRGRSWFLTQEKETGLDADKHLFFASAINTINVHRTYYGSCLFSIMVWQPLNLSCWCFVVCVSTCLISHM